MLLLGCQDFWAVTTSGSSPVTKCHAVPWGSDAKGPQVATSEECQIFPQQQNETIYVIHVFFVYMHTYMCKPIVCMYNLIYTIIYIYYVRCIYIINICIYIYICIIHIWIFRPPFVFGCCSCCTLLLGVDHKKYSRLPTRLFLIVFGRTGINKHQFVDFVILWSGMSVCFNNSPIDCCVGFGLRRFVST